MNYLYQRTRGGPPSGDPVHLCRGGARPSLLPLHWPTFRSPATYQGINFFIPFFLLLDSFWLLFPAPAPPAGAALSAAVPSVLTGPFEADATAAAGSVELS